MLVTLLKIKQRAPEVVQLDELGEVAHHADVEAAAHPSQEQLVGLARRNEHLGGNAHRARGPRRERARVCGRRLRAICSDDVVATCGEDDQLLHQHLHAAGQVVVRQQVDYTQLRPVRRRCPHDGVINQRRQWQRQVPGATTPLVVEGATLKPAQRLRLLHHSFCDKLQLAPRPKALTLVRV
eukprot:6853446-Prymnesium_polylepis.1